MFGVYVNVVMWFDVMLLYVVVVFVVLWFDMFVMVVFEFNVDLFEVGVMLFDVVCFVDVVGCVGYVLMVVDVFVVLMFVVFGVWFDV